MRSSSFSRTISASTDHASLCLQQSLVDLEEALNLGDLDRARDICAELQERSLSPKLFQEIDMRDPGKVVGVATLTRSSR